MSCSKNKEQCVCDIVRDIVRAQDDVQDDCCNSSCEQSIDDLLSPSTGNGARPTTVPFTLLCEGNCKPFIGSGVFEAPLGGSGNTFFGCVESPIYRAKNFVDNGECCVRLELLLPVTEGGSTPGPDGDSVCDFFPGRSIRDFQATGICFTVDLNCFCGIQCLPAVTPLSASGFPRNNED